ncbi:MAG: hypothetical protein NDJ89_01220 [Oligoflexia bacterium]|nr:hypothetical protein [Oligoflexia bacterium]
MKKILVWRWPVAIALLASTLAAPAQAAKKPLSFWIRIESCETVAGGVPDARPAPRQCAPVDLGALLEWNCKNDQAKCRQKKTFRNVASGARQFHLPKQTYRASILKDRRTRALRGSSCVTELPKPQVFRLENNGQVLTLTVERHCRAP